MAKPTSTTQDFVLICLFAALMAALALIPALYLPFIAAPITAQSLGPMLAGGILGAKRGFLSQALFLLLVAIGLPLLAAGRGGLGVFAGPTVGYLISWPIAAFMIGLLIESLWHKLNFIKAFLICIVGGIGVVYLIGMPVLSVKMGVPFVNTLIGSLIYIPGDLVKVVIATLAIITIKKSYPLIHAK